MKEPKDNAPSDEQNAISNDEKFDRVAYQRRYMREVYRPRKKRERDGLQD